MNIKIWCTAQFEGFHRWLAAPDCVSFLRDMHRHKFFVKAYWDVSHSDRQLEFFIQQRQLNQIINLRYSGREFEKSCEMIAEEIATILNCCSVEVSEDGENGAIWCRE